MFSNSELLILFLLQESSLLVWPAVLNWKLTSNYNFYVVRYLPNRTTHNLEDHSSSDPIR